MPDKIVVDYASAMKGAKAAEGIGLALITPSNERGQPSWLELAQQRFPRRLARVNELYCQLCYVGEELAELAEEMLFHLRDGTGEDDPPAG